MTQLAVRRAADPFAPPSVEAGAQPMSLGRDSLIKVARALTESGWRVAAIELRDLQHQPLDEDEQTFIEKQLRNSLNSGGGSSPYLFERTVLINELRLRAPQDAQLTTDVRLFGGGLIVTVASPVQVKYVEQELNSALARAWT